jgi:2-amino-4-hydroxy-6-hydroxymethyldihydropteridine diphosphokinase
MIIIGLGSNLTTEKYSTSKEILEAAIALLIKKGVKVEKTSNFYETEPVPKSDQPWFVNAAICVTTSLNAQELLNTLHGVESELGRIRKEKWEARIIDLDLLCYDDLVFPNKAEWVKKASQDNPEGSIIPHIRLHERDFVLIPMIDVAANWMHPIYNKNTLNMLNDLDSVGIVRLLSAK